MNENGIIQRPIEGKWFNVNPASINTSLFYSVKRYKSQEETRLLILEAIESVEMYPEKYEKPFKTMVPFKPVGDKCIKELDDYSKQVGDRMANWVEQALEWAQRLSNGETWETICNRPDTNRCYRLIQWKNGQIRFVGGTNNGVLKMPASNVGKTDWRPFDKTTLAVPLVVKYD